MYTGRPVTAPGFTLKDIIRKIAAKFARASLHGAKKPRCRKAAVAGRRLGNPDGGLASGEWRVISARSIKEEFRLRFSARITRQAGPLFYRNQAFKERAVPGRPVRAG
jgi:hypothetical protein